MGLQTSGHSRIDFSFGDPLQITTPTAQEFIGRVNFDRVRFMGFAKGVFKTCGNIGNTYRDCIWSGNAYGWYAQDAQRTGIPSSSVMHTGADRFFGCHFDMHTQSAVHVLDHTIGTGQLLFSGTLFEIVLRQTTLGNLQLAGSHLLWAYCDTFLGAGSNSFSITKDTASTVVHRGVSAHYFNDSSMVFPPYAGHKQVGTQTPSFSTVPGSILVTSVGGASILHASPMTSPLTLSGSVSSKLGSVVNDGMSLRACNEFVFPANSGYTPPGPVQCQIGQVVCRDGAGTQSLGRQRCHPVRGQHHAGNPLHQLQLDQPRRHLEQHGLERSVAVQLCGDTDPDRRRYAPGLC